MAEARKLAHLTSWDYLRIWIAGFILTPDLWQRMCRVGFCPKGIHADRYGSAYPKNAPETQP